MRRFVVRLLVLVSLSMMASTCDRTGSRRLPDDSKEGRTAVSARTNREEEATIGIQQRRSNSNEVTVGLAEGAPQASYLLGMEPAPLAAAVKKGVEALGAMRERLSKRRPPTPDASLADAVVARRERAPIMLREVGQAFGVEIGITSARLRNPANAPRAWAASFVRNATSSGNLTEKRVYDLGNKVGILEPVTVEAPCLRCHGDASTFDVGLKAKLQELYPEDKAIGFAAGELRGFTWVEIAKETL